MHIDSHALLEVDNAGCRFGYVNVFEGVNLAAEAGTVTAITGHAAAGKTTLLRCIADLEAPTSGTITRRAPVVGLVAAVNTKPGLSVFADLSAASIILGDDLTIVANYDPASGAHDGYDPATSAPVAQLLRTLADLGHAPIVSTHDPTLVEVADAVVLL